MHLLRVLMVGAGIVGAAGGSIAAGFNLDGAPKPAFLYVGDKGDRGWNEAIDQARSGTEKTLGLNIPYAENVPADAAAAATEGFINQGINIVIGNSAAYAEPFRVLAQKHPKTAFINLQDSRPTSGPPNLLSVYGRSYESQYLCGAVTGLTTKSGNIGFVAAQPTAIANSEINAYTLGVRLSHPDAVVHVIFVGTPDPDKERSAASTLINHGADVVGQSLDGATAQIVAQERGALATGHAVDLRELAPNATICSAIWSWDRYLVREIRKITAGNWTAAADTGLIGMTAGSNDISCCSRALPERSLPKLAAERDGIIITENKVFKGPLEDAEGRQRVEANESLGDDELWTMNWYVKGVTIEK